MTKEVLIARFEADNAKARKVARFSKRPEIPVYVEVKRRSSVSKIVIPVKPCSIIDDIPIQ